MKKVLYIDCCIRREESQTKKLADYFLEQIADNEKYEIETLCLMDEPLQFMSEGFFQQRERLLAEGNLNHHRFRYAHQFAEADKIVVAAPLWDLMFPALLKVYLENLCVEGITFGVGEQGLCGLCKADHMVFITTRGSFYEGSPMEMGSRYMGAMAEFFGIENYDCIFAEGLDLGIKPVEQLLEEAHPLADKVAAKF